MEIIFQDYYGKIMEICYKVLDERFDNNDIPQLVIVIHVVDKNLITILF